MTATATLLVCDHRGAGLDERARRLAEAGHSVELTRSLRQSLERLKSQRPDVVVLDPLAAGSTEVEALLSARLDEPPLPLLLVVELGRGAPIGPGLSALQRGPWDAIRREATLEEYGLRVERLREQARRRAEMDELRHKATHDDRTGLLRPLEFTEQLRAHVSAAQRHKLDMALLLVDLDRFGQVNKLHDHTVGDRIIERVGGVIRETLRIEDVAGRLGGDEFAVLLPYTRKVDAASVVQRLLTAIRELSGDFPGAHGPIQVSASVGFETFDGKDLESADVLRAHAEAALRQAKKRGGDRGVYFRSLSAPPAAGEERAADAPPGKAPSGKADE